MPKCSCTHAYQPLIKESDHCRQAKAEITTLSMYRMAHQSLYTTLVNFKPGCVLVKKKITKGLAGVQALSLKTKSYTIIAHLTLQVHLSEKCQLAHFGTSVTFPAHFFS